tara:strand:- start:38 stop:730 length:693 start_codon:yes stop_codon:yes gene_type:complete
MTKKYIYKNQSSLWGEPECIGFGTDEFYIKEIDRKLANKIIIKNHYSKKVYNATYINLGVFYKNNLKGVLQYGYAMNPASCGSVVKGTNKNEYLELNRMWIDDNCINYAESQAISYSIKFIKKKLKKIKWIQSFADERCGGFGIVYQACSFDFFGEHNSIFWTLDGQIYHNSLMTRNPKLSKSARHLQENKKRATSESLRQFRYIKFIDKREKKNCLLKEKPYLKHYNND